MNQKIGIILISILFLAEGSALAKNVRIANMSITNTPESLELVYLNIKGAFTQDMGKAILSGVPLTFSFFITLNKARKIWFGKEIKAIKITHTIKYNNLKKEFIIKRSWENDKPLNVQSFEKARKLMTEIENLEIVPISVLEKGEAYQVSAKAELSKVTLPYQLHYVLFFVSLWDFETEWYSIDFIY